MPFPLKEANASTVQEDDETVFADLSVEHERALAALQAVAEADAADRLRPELQRVVQVLCDTYEMLDLRIETTLGAAEADFLAALPELNGHEDELRLLARTLMDDLQTATGNMGDKPLLLHFSYQDKADLVEQFLSETNAQEIDQPNEEETSLPMDMRGGSL